MFTQNILSQVPEAELLKPICERCNTQYDGPEVPVSCRICDDPRSYVPPSGQSWITLKESILSTKFRNVIEPVPDSDGMIYTIVTQPKLGIGQNAFLIRTPQGNILWDLVAYIDDETVDKINSLGGINAIVISHPHFYTTFRTWSEAFGKITVYLASEDEQWVSLRDGSAYVLITEPTQEIIPGSGATAVKVGGHFPGSMILHWRSRIFTADSVMIVPSGLYSTDRPEGTVSFSFLWSYPNQIPLPSDAISNIVRAIMPFDFDIAHCGFPGLSINANAKRKLIQSADIVISILNGIQPGEQGKRDFWRA